MKLKFIIFFILILSEYNCNSILKISQFNNSDALSTYIVLLKESELFLNKNNQLYFKDSVNKFIDSCKEYKFFDGNRLEPLICYPILVNKNYSKALILVLTREKDMRGERVEYVHYVSGKYEKGRWLFKLKKGWVRSTGYVDNYPTLSDTEIGINVVETLLSYEYIVKDSNTNEELFNKEIYVW